MRKSFNKSWYQKYPWLENSVEKDAAFCFCCRNFGSQEEAMENTFTTKGFRSWDRALAGNFHVQFSRRRYVSVFVLFLFENMGISFLGFRQNCGSFFSAFAVVNNFLVAQTRHEWRPISRRVLPFFLTKLR